MDLFKIKYTLENFGKSRLNQIHDTGLYHRFIVLVSCDKHRMVGVKYEVCKKIN